jgi:hypothetical protein
MQAEDPPENLIQKEKTHWSTSWVGLLKSKVSRKPIVSQSLFTNPINRVMSMEQIFQDINKQMLEITYKVRSIAKDNTKSLKIYVAKIEASKT